MDDPTNTKRPMRFQMRLATLFWITFSAACFFAGRNWDSISQSLSNRFSSNQTRIQLAAGKTTIIKSNTSIPRFNLHDSAVCQASPLSANQIKVSAIAKGVTSIDLWDENNKITTYDIKVSE